MYDRKDKGTGPSHNSLTEEVEIPIALTEMPMLQTDKIVPYLGTEFF
jgi:hypothetical protein